MAEWVTVRSRAIRAIGYEPETRRMYIDFHDSRPIYVFCEVPEAVFRQFVRAPSIGQYYHRHIRDRYSCD